MPASTSAPDDVRMTPVNDREPVMSSLAGDEGVAALVGRTVEDAKGLVSAEIALYKARFGERLTAYRGAIVFFAVAGVLALCALIALLVGLILSLATLIGPGLATAAVVLTVLVVAAVLAMIGKGRLAPPRLDGRP